MHFLPLFFYQISEGQQAADILFNQGVLGVVVFTLFGMLTYIYRNGRQDDQKHREELMDLLKLYQQQNVDMVRIVEQANATMQSLIQTLQRNEVIEETIKDEFQKLKIH